jgi:hypothetical protein
MNKTSDHGRNISGLKLVFHIPPSFSSLRRSISKVCGMSFSKDKVGGP